MTPRELFIANRLPVHIGILFDAAWHRRSPQEMGLFYEQVRRRIEEELGRTWDAAQPPPVPNNPNQQGSPNGAAITQVRK